MNIVERIDAAVGCQHCTQPLDASPSGDFCGEDCQEAWHAARSIPLPRVTWRIEIRLRTQPRIAVLQASLGEQRVERVLDAERVQCRIWTLGREMAHVQHFVDEGRSLQDAVDQVLQITGVLAPAMSLAPVFANLREQLARVNLTPISQALAALRPPAGRGER